MVLGIVGSEGAKFSFAGEKTARACIREHLAHHKPSMVVSGRCPLGGIDVWAIDEARKAGIPVWEFAPATPHWSTGYKPRNLQIAKASDHVVCITVRRYREHYAGMRFGLCYHCREASHIKSGGCWTVKQARKMGKTGSIDVIEPD